MSKVKVKIILDTDKNNYPAWVTDALDVLGLNKISHCIAKQFNENHLEEDFLRKGNERNSEFNPGSFTFEDKPIPSAPVQTPSSTVRDRPRQKINPSDQEERKLEHPNGS